MDTVPGYLVFPLGAFAGMFLLTFAMRWYRQSCLAFGKFSAPEGTPPRNVPIFPLLLVTLLNPVPWLIVIGVPYCIYSVMTSQHPGLWLWFVWGLIVGTPCLALLTLVMAKRTQLRNAKRKEAAHSAK